MLPPPSPAPAVHPRGCGERACVTSAYIGVIGSSPRVRGTRILRADASIPHRFIPAGAGNACSFAPAPPSITVHPRGCGEREARRGIPARMYGSSPRVRGTPNPFRTHPAAVRFIPAGAGNACNRRFPPRRMTVHPRGCGERGATILQGATTSGSSPRVRGTLGTLVTKANMCRFIPAGAGNAEAKGAEDSNSPVHPRGCGERASLITPSKTVAGSSPRVRGTRDCQCRPEYDERFIPAGAGNALNSSRPALPLPVHPRGCGERGNADFAAHVPIRFIPAGAGNASFLSGVVTFATVHPRGCGERAEYEPLDPESDGSSPRVRGTQPHKLVGSQSTRFIPAGAGNAVLPMR